MRLLLTILISLPILLIASLPVKIRQGMKYEEAREILLNSGWQAINMHIMPNGVPLPCWANWKDDKEYSCRFKEIESCSGTGMGFCLMWFFDGEDRYLRVLTAGGEPPNAVVHSWKKTKEKPHIEVFSGN